MQAKYEKPIVLVNGEHAEGVYMASGDGTMTEGNESSGCYTASAYIHQKPETGRDSYVIQVNGRHDAGHNCNKQVLHLHFNQPVTYLSSNGKLKSGDGTANIHIDYSYWNNHTDNIGLGDVYVKAGPGLAITGVSITDDDGRC